MFKALFTIIINLIATIIQLVLWPLNEIISLALPDLSGTITQVSQSITTWFSGFSWALGIVPPIVITTITIIIGIEIAKHSIFVTSHVIVKVWNVLQKLKFW